ncbi:MAG: TfoX/Sxy family protein [Turneriella sp.]
MAYDEHLADRIAQALRSQHRGFAEKKMFGGLCFLVKDKMCMGIVGNQLMARIDPAEYDKFLKEPGVGPMTFSGKEMKGFLYVQPAAIDRDEDLALWVRRCLDFNPLAKSSKVKAKKSANPPRAKASAKKPKSRKQTKKD